jgi:hypothetical protein
MLDATWNGAKRALAMVSDAWHHAVSIMRVQHHLIELKYDERTCKRCDRIPAVYEVPSSGHGYRSDEDPTTFVGLTTKDTGTRP